NSGTSFSFLKKRISLPYGIRFGRPTTNGQRGSNVHDLFTVLISSPFSANSNQCAYGAFAAALSRGNSSPLSPITAARNNLSNSARKALTIKRREIRVCVSFLSSFEATRITSKLRAHYPTARAPNEGFRAVNICADRTVDLGD